MANTVKIARKLNSAGVQWDEAQTHAEVITDAVDDALGEVATKDFIEYRLAQQDSKMDKVRIEMAELRAEFKSSQLSLTRWIIGLGTSMIGLIIALGSIIISNKLF